MPDINGTFRLRPRAEDFRPCVWCQAPTDVMMRTPGRPELVSVPLHMGCAGAVIVAYNDMRAGRKLTGDAAAGMARLTQYQQIGSGAGRAP